LYARRPVMPSDTFATPPDGRVCTTWRTKFTPLNWVRPALPPVGANDVMNWPRSTRDGAKYGAAGAPENVSVNPSTVHCAAVQTVPPVPPLNVPDVENMTICAEPETAFITT